MQKEIAVEVIAKELQKAQAMNDKLVKELGDIKSLLNKLTNS